MYLRRSIHQSILHLRSTSILVTSLIYTRPNEESHDGNGTFKKVEEKGRYTEGITQILNDDNNPTVRYEGARLEQRWDLGLHIYFGVNEDVKGSGAWWPRLRRNLSYGVCRAGFWTVRLGMIQHLGEVWDGPVIQVGQANLYFTVINLSSPAPLVLRLQ